MLKNKCSVWKRIKFPTFWYNCYYFTWSDTYFIQLETLLINYPSYITNYKSCSSDANGSSHFMICVSSLHFSQKPAICPYHEPDQSSPCLTHPIIFVIPMLMSTPFYVYAFYWVPTHLCFPAKTQSASLPYPTHVTWPTGIIMLASLICGSFLLNSQLKLRRLPKAYRHFTASILCNFHTSLTFVSIYFSCRSVSTDWGILFPCIS